MENLQVRFGKVQVLSRNQLNDLAADGFRGLRVIQFRVYVSARKVCAINGWACYSAVNNRRSRPTMRVGQADSRGDKDRLDVVGCAQAPVALKR